MSEWLVECGDAGAIMSQMPESSVDCIVTSPPYNKNGLQGRVKQGNQIWDSHNIDYDTHGDDMAEDDYQAWMIESLNEMWRIIKPQGSIFFNHKPRRHSNRVHLPTEFIERSHLTIYQVIIWNRKTSPNIRNDILVPSTEYIYWLVKGKPVVYRSALDRKYLGEVWDISPTRQGSHPASFPEQLAENCILLTTKKGDRVVDPFAGSGTTLLVASRLQREAVGIDISSRYVALSETALGATQEIASVEGNEE